MAVKKERYLTIYSHNALHAAITNVEKCLHVMRRAHKTWRQEDLPDVSAALSSIAKALKGYGYLGENQYKRTRR